MSRIEIQTGTEGPRHDPYGWEEITVRRMNDQVVVTLHEGLATWVRIDGVGTVHEGYNPLLTADMIRKVFEAWAGITPDIARKAYNRFHSVCRDCGCRDVYWKSGFPGESFAFCCDCDAVVDYSFNESAII